MTDLAATIDSIADDDGVISLNEEQLEAGRLIQHWFNHSKQPHWCLGGYAGTGKTTVVKSALQTLPLDPDNIVLCAYTAKAASVIRSKAPQYDARTIHSLIYRRRSTPELDRLRDQLAYLRKQQKTANVQNDIETTSKKLAQLRHTAPKAWRKKTQAEFERNADYRLIVADECSMIDEPIFNDLLSFGKKVLFLGDPGQLDPIQIGKKQRKLHELAPEKFLLQKIMRNDRAIVTMADLARRRIEIPVTHKVKDGFGKMLQCEVPETALTSADQIICHKHVTRRNLNVRVRAAIGCNTLYPVAGEKVVCKLNNHDAGLSNGVTYVLRSDAKNRGDYLLLDLEGVDELVEADKRMFDAYLDEGVAEDVDMGHCKFNQNKPPFDFGYTLTVHSAQGSEWGRVIVWDDFKMRKYQPEQYAKWLYTAITRAKEACVVVMP